MPTPERERDCLFGHNRELVQCAAMQRVDDSSRTSASRVHMNPRIRKHALMHHGACVSRRLSMHRRLRCMPTVHARARVSCGGKTHPPSDQLPYVCQSAYPGNTSPTHQCRTSTWMATTMATMVTMMAPTTMTTMETAVRRIDVIRFVRIRSDSTGFVRVRRRRFHQID